MLLAGRGARTEDLIAGGQCALDVEGHTRALCRRTRLRADVHFVSTERRADVPDLREVKRPCLIFQATDTEYAR